MTKKTFASLRGSLSLLLVLVTFNTLLVQGAKQAQAQMQRPVIDHYLSRGIDERKLSGLAAATRKAGVWNDPTLTLFKLVVSDAKPEDLLKWAEMQYIPARELESFVEAGLSPYQAIEAATRNPAEYFAQTMKASRDFGTVEVGLRADLILLEANPLQSVANLSKRAGVMVRGRWLPESELRKMLENVAALNRQSTEGNTSKGNFGGTWALDKSNSEGLPPDMDQLMTVVQTGDKLSVETKLITGQGEQVVPDSYVLDGKEVDFTPRTPGGQSGKGKRISKWGADGNSIEVSEKATFDTPEGVVNIDATRKWTLSPDGKTLKIEMAVDGPNGKQLLKRTFIRK